ncbi:anthranilate 1,2-dioxygenase small subunit [Paraburkholderia caffeinilytica]|uniref:anthranilate 1,2-dioxygenase small subunit n=1 Tax=Paraburkholderia caffeinilytica TaxID=1761016 RepID=UPI0038B9B881
MSVLRESVEDFLYRKAELCDRQQWDEYLELFDPTSVFHVPQWDSEHLYTVDPKQGMSLIYYADRSGLEDRVYRIRTGKSAASTPLPRTMHQITNVRVTELSATTVQAGTNWSTFHTRHGETGYFYGHATYELRRIDDTWRISSKHALLLNDRINEVLDFYHL